MKKLSHNLFNVVVILFVITVLISVIYHIAGISHPVFIEHMNSSSAESQEEGASQYYNWGFKPINDPVKHDNHKIYMKKKYNDKCKKYFYNYYLEKDDHCRNCNILNNKDIDKYVLKSSVPSCPDMSKYVLKNEIPICPNINEYIKKSDIKPCPDLRDYIKKNKLKPHNNFYNKCKTINEYNIQDHNDISNYIRKDKINEYINNKNKYNYNSNLINVQNADYGNIGKYANLSYLNDNQYSKILNDIPKNLC